MRVVAGAVLVILLAGCLGERRPGPPPAPAKVVHRVHLRRPSAPVRPPQFVISSFDGSGGARLLGYWRGVARTVNAKFTFFVSGVYLIDWAQRNRYAPPGLPPSGLAPAETRTRFRWSLAQ